MNHYFVRIAASVVVLAVCSLASAAVTERDWLAPGDGLLTFDDIHHREWLDLTESLTIDLGKRAPDDSFSFDYERDLLAELEPGGRLEGFTAATTEDILSLAMSAGVDTSTSEFATNAVPVGGLMGLLGPTYARGEPIGSIGSSAYLFGLSSTLSLEPTSLDDRLLANLMYNYSPSPSDSSQAQLVFGYASELSRSDTTGMWLYRNTQAVPECSSLSLLCIAVVCGTATVVRVAK
ncbi:hypothetical protein [Aeoliella mucimassa]|uniref:Uncharacterized protein n=1 Tax=Aeoliella mucimassa TaxID=2527972 RepID=A0A518AI88_9BACT|nr:hypothetical protein [Aeoliella mucimassa]QDU54435.1 hypothetical protein Pan181_06160 [Aeoliella mucimassa]